jgi:hypothetical protein
MTVTATPKLAIATELLERGIELFLRGDSFHCALHLAGAAEEILNVHARSIEMPDGERLVPTFDQVKASVIKVLATQNESERIQAERWAYDRLTGPKNSVKHMRGGRDGNFVYDSEQEAADVIDRAVSTYIQTNQTLGNPLASLIAAFDRITRGDPAG